MAAKIEKAKLLEKGSRMMEARIEEEIIAQKMMADHQERSNKKRGEGSLPTVNFSSSKRRMPGDEADGAWCTWGGLNLVASGGNKQWQRGIR